MMKKYLFSTVLLSILLSSPLLTNAQYRLSGTLTTPTGTPIENVEIDIEELNAPAAIANTFTDENGFYEFENLETDIQYQITPVKNSPITDGVTGLDIILSGLHLIGVMPFTSPSQAWASNVDTEIGAISTLDLVHVMRGIVEISETYPTNKSWLFDALIDPNQPTTSVLIDGISADTELDFQAIKLGDVNFSVGIPTPYVEQKMILTTEGLQVSAGTEVDIAIKTQDVIDLFGYQFSLGFDTDALEFIELTREALPGFTNGGIFGYTRLDQGLIHTLLTNTQIRGFDAETTLFTIRFNVSQDGNIRDFLRIASEGIPDEAYAENLDIRPVVFAWTQGPVSVQAPREIQISRASLSPNPFHQQTQLQFTLVENSPAHIIIYNAAGKMVKEIQGDYSQGVNHVLIDLDADSATGIFYGEIRTPKDAQHLILLGM